MGVVDTLVMEAKVSGLERAKADIAGLGEQGNVLGKLLGGGGNTATQAITAIGVAALVATGIAVRMAANFQEGLTSLVTGAGEAESNIDMVRKGILAMSVDTATSTKQLTDGMYMIESAGYHGAAGLSILDAAAKGARVGNADLGVVANATTTVMKDFASTGITAAQSVNLLIATVASGKTHMEDLSGSLSTILPVAAAAHIKITDVAGAMATMTSEGVPAAQAATYLRQTILALEAPSSKAKKVLDDIGLSSDTVAKTMQTNLPAALKMITDAVGKKFPEGSAAYVSALKDIAGGSRTMQGILDLAGPHFDTFRANVDGIASAVTRGGTSIIGWTKVQGDFNFQIDKAKAFVAALFIAVGTQLLPKLTELMTFINNAAQGGMKTFMGIPDVLKRLGDSYTVVDGPMKTFGKHADEDSTILVRHKGILTEVGEVAKVVGGFIQDKLSGAMAYLQPYITQASVAVRKFADDLSQKLGPAATNVFHFIEAALAFLQIIWNAAWPAMSAVLVGVWDMIQGVVKVAWSLVSGIIKVGLDILGGNWKAAWTDFKDMLGGIMDGIIQIVTGAMKIVVGVVLAAVEAVLGLLARIPGPIGDAARNALAAVQGIAAQMRQAGEDAGNKFAAGLASRAAAVRAAANDIANAGVPGGGGGGTQHAAGTEDAVGGIVRVHRDETIYLPAHSIVRNPLQQEMWGQPATPQKTIHIEQYFSGTGYDAKQAAAEAWWQATLHGG